MKTLFAILLASAFTVGTVSAYTGKSQTSVKGDCSEKCKDKDAKKDGDSKSETKKDDKQ